MDEETKSQLIFSKNYRARHGKQITTLKMAMLKADSLDKSTRHAIERRQLCKAYVDQVLVQHYPTGLYWNDRSYWSREDDPFSTCELEI